MAAFTIMTFSALSLRQIGFSHMQLYANISYPQNRGIGLRRHIPANLYQNIGVLAVSDADLGGKSH